MRVIVADGMQPPIDKACGEGLMPDGLAALERLGIQMPLEQARPFRGIRFLSKARSADAALLSVSAKLLMWRTRSGARLLPGPSFLLVR